MYSNSSKTKYNKQKIEKIINDHQGEKNKDSLCHFGRFNRPDLACQVTIFGNFNQEIIDVQGNLKKEIVEIHAETIKKSSKSIFKKLILRLKFNFS